MAKRSRQTGFTLIEVACVVMILAMNVTALLTMWNAGLSCYSTASAQTVVNQELVKGLDSMIAEVTEAAAHTIIGVPPDDGWYTKVGFRKIAGIAGGHPVYTPYTIVYSLGGADSTQIIRTTGGAPRVVANNVLEFRVRRPSANPDILEIAVRSEKDPVTVPPVASSLQFMVNMRN